MQIGDVYHILYECQITAQDECELSMQIGDVYHILYECQVTAQGECKLVCKLEMFTISYMSVKLLLKANVSLVCVNIRFNVNHKIE